MYFQEYEKDETFKVDLVEVSEGSKLGRIKKTIITIVNDDGEHSCCINGKKIFFKFFLLAISFSL